MRHTRHLWLIGALLAALLLAACGGGGQGLAGTSWRLIEIDGQLVPEGVDATINFEEGGQVSGTSGCNQYGGAYSVDGGQISFPEIAMTEMDCLEDGIMQLELTFIDALSAGGTFDNQGDSLTIDAANGTTLTFASQ